MATLTLGTNSYASQVEADAYTTLYGLDAISNSDFLIQATKYIDRTFAGRFIGTRQTTTQSLNWPRSSTNETVSTDNGFITVDSDGNYIDLSVIPSMVKEATIEIAIQLQSGVELYVQPNPAITEESNSVDVISSSRKYASPYVSKTIGDVDLFKTELILRPVLKSAGGSIRLVR